MTLKMFSAPDHYAMLQGWWTRHGWPPVPQVILPRLGMIVDGDRESLAAGFLYMDNSVGVSMLEWVVTNPQVAPLRAAAGLKNLVEFMGQEAVRNGYGVMLATCKVPGLVKLYERCGFAKTDEGMTHLVRVLR